MSSFLIDPDYGLDAPEITTPSTPASNRRRLYPKADGWYDLDDGGTEKGLATTDHTHAVDELSDVTLTSLGDGEVLVSSGGDFVNNTLAEAGIAADDHNHGTNGVVTQHLTADVSNPPTDAELDSAFGTPATVGAGFLAGIDDNGGDTNFYLVYSTGSSWVIFTGTKAV